MAAGVSRALDKVPNVPGPLPINSGALVMGGDYRGLALVRSLGRQGIQVWAINQEEQLWAGMSRFARKTLFYPRWDREEGVAFLLDLGRKWGLEGWMLFPTSDDSVRLVSIHYKRLSEVFRVTVPPWESLERVVDKKLLHQLADQVGVDRPKTYYAACREQLASLELSFPLILKPATRHELNRLTAAKAWRVDDSDSLLSRYDEACHLLPPESLMIQELIPGGGESQFSFAAACEEGRPLAYLVARRTRQFPMDFGRASTFVETVDEPGVIEPSKKLLQAIKYTGLVEVEFKRDPRDGRFKLLDFNPRVWGWYSLCEGAGVNFGYLLWLQYLRQPIPKVSVRPGVRWVRMTSDLLASLEEILGGRLSMSEYLRSVFGPKESAIFSWDDLLPGLLEIPLLSYVASRRLLRGNGL